MLTMLKACPLWVSYGFASVFLVPGYMLFSRKGRNSVKEFLKHAGKSYNICALYRSFNSFSRAIIDRFAAFAGRHFEITLADNHHFLKLETSESGFIMLGSHLGNYELTGYSLRQTRKPLNVVLFSGEAEAVMRGRRNLFGQKNINIISVLPDSLDHVFNLNAALDRGEIVSIAADRTFGSSKSVDVRFMGKLAPLPLGPFILAATHNVPVLAVFMLKRGYKRYEAVCYPVTLDDSEITLSTRLRAEVLCRRYATILQQVALNNPEQWYNYYDFWRHYE